MILPRIKKYRHMAGTFSQRIVFEPCCEAALTASRFLSIFIPTVSFEISASATIFFKEKMFTKVGSYELKVEQESITLFYGDLEGIRNAIATFSQIYNDGVIECCEIFDEPDNHFRSCMFDLARGYVEIACLKEHILRMAILKYNHIHLHLMDRQSYALKSEVVPNPDNHRLYTKQEMKELCEFCSSLCLEVIPEIEIPAHAVNQIKALPELACDIISKKKAVETICRLSNPRKREFTDNKRGVSSWVVCAGKESTYELYEKIIAEICEVFAGKYLHVGGDELEFPNLGAHHHWDNCKQCKQRMQQEKVSDIRGLYYYLMRRIHKIVSKYGKKMIIWNDQLDVSNPIDIPKDIIVEYWNGGVITNEKYILQKLCNQGFEVINAHYRYTYPDLPSYMQEHNIREWNVKTDMLGESEVQGRILGGETCAWELGNPLYDFYPCSLPVCMTLFADRVWNNDVVVYDEKYRESVFSVIIGENIEWHPFVFFKEIIPPRDSQRNQLEGIDFDNVDCNILQEILLKMQMINQDEIYGKIVLSSYIDLLQRIKDCFE